MVDRCVTLTEAADLPSADSRVALVAVDWGTTTRRVFHIGDTGEILRKRSEPLGVAKLVAGEIHTHVAELRSEAGDSPLLLAGMVGSTLGLAKTPYVSCPAGLVELARQCVDLGERAWIVPGLAFRGEAWCDVMRGEELIVLGGVAAGLIPADALVCQPGTHNKWIRLADGKIASFRTLMTGEIFSLLRGTGTLAPLLADEVKVGPTFLAAVERGIAGKGAFADLFAVRAGVMLDDIKDPASLASGLLIGDDLRVGLAECRGPIHIAGSGGLANLYRVALAHVGLPAVIIDAEESFAAGASALVGKGILPC